jgi:hypothetical protein
MLYLKRSIFNHSKILRINGKIKGNSAKHKEKEKGILDKRLNKNIDKKKKFGKIRRGNLKENVKKREEKKTSGYQIIRNCKNS